MKLFIFKVSPKWDYCGGGLVIVAKKFENCLGLLQKYIHKTDPNDSTKYTLYTDEGELTAASGEFLLVESFSIEDDFERVVMLDYNYA